MLVLKEPTSSGVVVSAARARDETISYEGLKLPCKSAIIALVVGECCTNVPVYFAGFWLENPQLTLVKWGRNLLTDRPHSLIIQHRYGEIRMPVGYDFTVFSALRGVYLSHPCPHLYL